MSEGVAQNINDEQAVVGEPASHPHQAAVVGEPPEEMAPVLGEPVPFANGLGDQQPISPSSVDETSINGVQTSIHLHSSLEPPHLSNPSSAEPDETAPILQEVPAAEESSASGSRIGEAPVEVVAQQSDLPVAENPHPSEPHVEEVSSASGVPATDATDAVDVPAEIAPCRHDANHSVEEEPTTDTDIPNVVEVSHIADMPSEVLPPVTTENPFLTLDEGSTADDEKEDPLVLDQSPPTTLVSVEAPDATVSPAQDETLSKGLGASDTAQLEETTIPLSHSQEGEHLASIQIPLEDTPSEGAEVGIEDAHSVVHEIASHGDVPALDSDADKAVPVEIETGHTEVEHNLTAQPDQASETEVSAQENDTRGEIPAGSETASSGVEQVLSRETPLSESLTKESSTPREDALQEDLTTSDTSQVPNDLKGPVETPMASKDTRSISSDECLVDQASSEEASLPPAANGDNGFQHDEACNLEKGQDLSKDEDESAEAKEKSSSRTKLPFIFTGLAIAAVSVALVSISRPH